MGLLSALKYAYFGIRFGNKRATLKLLSAECSWPGAHAAVWLGANDESRWIQGGVEINNGEQHPSAYIEIGLGGKQVFFDAVPVEFGESVSIRLICEGRTWSVVRNGVRCVREITLSHATVDSMLETFGGSVAVGVINGRTIKSH